MSIGLEMQLDKLAEKMLDARQDQQEEVKTMRKVFKDASLRKNLAEHPAMKKLIAMFKKRERSYSNLLANKEDATEKQRQDWFARRNECRFFLRFFEAADRTIDSLAREVEYQLSDEISEDVDSE